MMQRCRSCGVPKGTQQVGCRQAAAHWSGRRSRDCNQDPATPSDVRGNRRIIVGCPRSWRNGRPGPLLGQMVSLCAEFSARPGASSRVARWGRGVPAVLGMKLSRLRLVLPRHSKVIENALKNDSIFGADNLQVAADCLCLAATQVALT